MEFIQMIRYVNSKLKEGNKIDAIRTNLNIGEKAFLKIVKENNYKYNQKLKQYIPISEANTKTNTEAYTGTNTETNTIGLEPIKAYTNTIVLDTQYNCLQANTLDYLTNNIDVLKNIIDRFANTVPNTETNTGIIIDLLCDKHIKPNPKAIRINHFIYEDWQKFCDENNYYSKQDLISMALKEYMQSHRKK